MKKKIKNLTLEEFIELAKKHEKDCSRCPLCSILEIKCQNFCDLSSKEKMFVKIALDQEIEVDLDEKED